MKGLPFLIAGGGIAGIAAALACGRFADVRVLERQDPIQETGAGVQIGPNAIRALQAIGAWEAVEPFAGKPNEIHMRDGASGRLLRRIKLGDVFFRRFGAPYRVIHRADLHRALIGVARLKSNIQIESGVSVSAGETQDGVAILRIAQGAEVKGCAALAADGVGSILRQQLFPGSRAVDSGLVFHRALLDSAPPLPEIEFSCVNLWLCPAGHVVHYPVGHGESLNLVHVTARGISRKDAGKTCCEPLRKLLAAPGDWKEWPGLFAPPLATWAQGKIALIGDAAHGTLPFLAQGAAMALEDAASLRHGIDSFDRLLTRKSRTARLHHATVLAGRTYHQTGFAARLRNAALQIIPDAALMQQMAWIYAYDP